MTANVIMIVPAPNMVAMKMSSQQLEINDNCLESQRGFLKSSLYPRSNVV